MVNAIIRELEMRNPYLNSDLVETIYFGGGTPSLLEISELKKIFQCIRDNYAVASKAEITLEANPDDITQNLLGTYLELGINRISLGIQSFDENHLKYLNRSHSAVQSQEAIQLIAGSGFSNYTIDLIYGIPATSHGIWEHDLAIAHSYQVPHISCYNLTIETQTVFGKWMAQGKIKEVTEEFALEQYELLVQKMTSNGYQQYEISNFCRLGYRSRHNSNYWNQENYLGVGPGAHSFNQESRQYNIANNTKYIQSIIAGNVPATIEHLNHKTKVNEWVLTKLRTYDGLDMLDLESRLGYRLVDEQGGTLKKFEQENLITQFENILQLTHKGRLVADWVAGELFIL